MTGSDWALLSIIGVALPFCVSFVEALTGSVFVAETLRALVLILVGMEINEKSRQ